MKEVFVIAPPQLLQCGCPLLQLNGDDKLLASFPTLTSSLRYWTGPFGGCLKSNENL